MRLIPGTRIIVSLDNEEYHFILVTSGGGEFGRLNIKAPLAQLLGAMTTGNTVQAWTPRIVGAEPMRVELVAISEPSA